MSGRSGAISHTTLHEATKGNRLPSWGTTAEFVKACGGDPEDYRERWEQANLIVRGPSASLPPNAVGNANAPAQPSIAGQANVAGTPSVPAQANAANAAAVRPPGEAAASAVDAGERPSVHMVVGSQAQPVSDEPAASPFPPNETSATPPPPVHSAAPPQPSGQLTGPAPVSAQASGVAAPSVTPLHELPGGPASQPPAVLGGDLRGAAGGEQQVTPPLPAKRSKKRMRITYLAASAILATGVGAVIYTVVESTGGSKPQENVPSPSDRPSAAAAAVGCPVKPSQPAWAPPLHKGDAAAFVDDITLRDCTLVGTNTTVVKVWRIRNTGALYWRGYSLRRLDLPLRPDDCRTKTRVPINTTRPGDTVDIHVEITTPRKPGFCLARFKMLDTAGRVAFSGNRPVNFQLVVRGH
ncbi:hypothetical protein EBO15_21415 [Actinomadura harenae]|uniref:Nbr1 FW domain-containing protein n=2 Tax=Actinomadura harenae TaxID=2483351 RepID=A0A3M2LX15_9ACTN|nr:hypothetical protein EBO15_21415 [Actinomadura harenae]